jgi:type II secretory pathway pseudopilin PulG
MKPFHAFVLLVIVMTLSIVAVMVIISMQQSELNSQALSIQSIQNELDQDYTMVGSHLKLFSEHESATEFTFPDVGETEANIVLTKGDQTIDGQKTLVESLVISSGTIPLTLGTGTNQFKLDIGSSAAVRTYSVPDVGVTADFVMSEGNQTVNGVKELPDGVQLQGGSTLDYYEQATVSVNLYGPWASAQAVTIHFHRVGKQVTMYIPTVQSTGSVALHIDTAATHPIPVRFRPRDYLTMDMYVPIMVTDNGSIKQGALRLVSNSGNFEMYRWDGTQLTSFTGAGATGIHSLSVQYLTS